MIILRSIYVAANGNISLFLWLSSIPLCMCVCVYIYIHGHIHGIFFIYSSVDGHLGCFHTLTIVNKTALNIGVLVPFWMCCHFFQIYYPGVELLGHIYWVPGMSTKSPLLPSPLTLSRWPCLQQSMNSFSFLLKTPYKVVCLCPRTFLPSPRSWGPPLVSNFLLPWSSVSNPWQHSQGYPLSLLHLQAFPFY